MKRAFIGIGSNIDPAKNVSAALRALAAEVRVIKISTIYQTAPEHGLDQPSFYNGVALIETDLPPETLKFQVLRKIEASLGRKRTADKNAVRTIDLDLLIYDDLILKTPGLEIPDPGISCRAVLTIPLNDIAPHLVLPGMTKSVSVMAHTMPRTAMNALHSYTAQLRHELGLSNETQPLQEK